MIYLDASVVIARLYGEDRQPPHVLWEQSLVSSRLLAYEVWTRIHSRGISASHGEAARAILGRVAYLEMVSEVLERARQPFPFPLRTLDALHLSSLDFLAAQGQRVALASYDERMVAVARGLDYEIYALD